MDLEPTYGFLIVKTFARLYRDYVTDYGLKKDFYALPRLDKTPEEYRIQYRGLHRDALNDYEDSELPAEIRMAELAESERCWDGFLFRLDDALEVFELLGESKPHYELVWSRTAGSGRRPPAGFAAIGHEPSWFAGDHFSALCDCMVIPRWHGTDVDGTLFLDHFRRLNQHGLFSTAHEATEFLDYYLSFDWTERGDFLCAEVFIPETPERRPHDV